MQVDNWHIHELHSNEVRNSGGIQPPGFMNLHWHIIAKGYCLIWTSPYAQDDDAGGPAGHRQGAGGRPAERHRGAHPARGAGVHPAPHLPGARRVAANADLANSDALELARAVDPDGRRTIGVNLNLILDPGKGWVSLKCL